MSITTEAKRIPTRYVGEATHRRTAGDIIRVVKSNRDFTAFKKAYHWAAFKSYVVQESNHVQDVPH